MSTLPSESSAHDGDPVGGRRRRRAQQLLLSPQARHAAQRTDDEIRDSLTWHSAIWSQLSLPYRVKPGQTIYERTNGRFTLTMVAPPGLLPYGVYDRRFLLWMDDTAFRQQSPILALDDRAIYEFVRSVSPGDPARTRLYRSEQLRVEESMYRLYSVTPSLLDRSDPSAERARKLAILTGYDLWLGRESDAAPLWDSAIILGDEYFSALMSHPVPIDKKLLTVLGKSAEAIDVATWLPWRVHPSVQSRPTQRPISWSALLNQFGGQNGSDRYKRYSLKARIEEVAAFYADHGDFVTVDQQGLRINRPVELLPGRRPVRTIPLGIRGASRRPLKRPGENR